MYDLIIIGSGAAGLSAGLYAGRYKLKTLIVEGDFGGETARAGLISNYPGVKPIDGYDLMNTMKEQGKSFGTEFKSGWVTKINRDGHCYKVTVDNKTDIDCKLIIFAGGAEHRRLGLPNERELTGKGVHYCMTCDGPLYGGKKVIIIGGGDSSVKDTLHASDYAEHIYLVTMEDEVRGEPVNFEAMKKLGNKVTIITKTSIKEIVGKDKFEKIILSKPFEGKDELVADGLFVRIGFKPSVDLATSIGVELDPAGYIKVDNMMHTNIDGAFAGGDTVNHFGRFKQDITAAAMGTVAATSAYEDNKKHGDLCQLHAIVNDQTPYPMTN